MKGFILPLISLIPPFFIATGSVAIFGEGAVAAYLGYGLALYVWYLTGKALNEAFSDKKDKQSQS
ncbi:hypothetical protein [Limnobacter sp.]|uniref:hypothetical protein n=1 Tax=Limnobacter sp. TaxID=2003368 RepID=UPI00258B8BAE|nr:hypothetical protein [Limnobacter sp.]